MLKERIAEAGRLGVKSVMFAGTGEPLLHKGISGIVDSAVGSGLDVAFTTNGVLLDKLGPVEKCTWIKVSLNAGRQESYAKIHQTNPKDWDRVWGGITRAVKRKGNCTIGVQAVVLPENVYEMRELAAHCVDAGVDYLVLKPYSQGTFSIVQRDDIDYSAMRSYLQSVSDFDTKTFKVIYRGNAISEEIDKRHRYQKCLATPFFWTYCTGDGRMFTCSAHLMDDSFCIGNINTQSFQEIWEGPERKRQWEQMKTFNISKCRLNCRMNQQNKYLHSLTHTAHANFI
jgi:radical SAM protein with 4Fe4S-binding SPASM domain